MTEADWIAFFRRSEIPAFNAAMLADPENDLPRLVFADWVEENCPSVPFVMALRRSIANPEIPEWVPNFSMVVKGHELRLWRGRIEVGIDMSDPGFDAEPDEFVRAAWYSGWVGRLKLRGLEGSTTPFIPESAGRIEWLDLFDAGDRAFTLRWIARRWQLPSLTGVDLRPNPLVDAEAVVLASHQAFCNLKVLHVNAGQLSANARHALANSKTLSEHIRAQFRRPA